MAACLKLGPQFPEVVDLAVVGNDETPIRGRHGLATRRCEVDYGEATMAEAKRPFDEMALAVGTSVSDGVGHLA